jgi:hypothetical protein
MCENKLKNNEKKDEGKGAISSALFLFLGQTVLYLINVERYFSRARAWLSHCPGLEKISPRAACCAGLLYMHTLSVPSK